MGNSILRDIIDAGKEVKNIAANTFDKSNMSIARQAKKGTLPFSVLASRSLSLENMSMIDKALERHFVSFVRIVSSLNSVTTEKDVESYLSNLHQGYSLSDYLPRGIVESADLGLSQKLNNLHEFNMSLGLTNENNMIVESKDLPLRKRNGYFNTLNNLLEGRVVSTNKGIFHINEGMISEIFLIENADMTYDICQTEPFAESFNIKTVNKTVLIKEMANLNNLSRKEYVYPFVESCLNDFTKSTELSVITESNPPATKAKPKKYGMGTKEDPFHLLTKDETPKGPTSIERSVANGLTDNDIKKANELVPTMVRLITNFQKDGKIVRTEEYIIGVKAELHPIDTKSMIENLVKGVKKDNTFFNFIRFTTGEINFFKDFVFAIDDIKDEINTKYNDNVWWSALIRRKKAAFIKRIGNHIGIKGKLLPNATIVASQDEIDYIKQNYKIDLTKKTMVDKLFSTYFLLAFVICDPSTETCRFMFDGDKDFTTYSFASLERENSNKTKEISNIMQILGKM